MNNIEDDGLDKLFKARLNEPEHAAGYRESDWDALEQMLDERERKGLIVFWLPILGGVAALILLGFGWFYFMGNNAAIKNNPVVKNKVETIGPDKLTSHNTIAKNQPVTETKTASGDQVIPARETLAQVKNKTTSKVNIGDIGSGKNKKPGDTEQTGILANNPNKTSAPKKPVNVIASTDGYNQGGDSPTVNNLSGINDEGFQQLAAGGQVASLPRNIDLMAGADSISGIKKSAQKFGTGVKLTNNPRRAQLAITVLASPDINGVGSFSQARVGTNAGLLFSVGVSKFTFSTGALYSKKPYQANFSDYNIGYALKYPPDNVSADCRVLDIPLNVDFQVYSKRRNKLSIGSGLSSYIMLSEKYVYNYATPYNYAPAGIDIVNKNHYFFGVLNLEATYQRQLNSKFSLGVQPYLKLPITNIGYGQVKLQSSGMAVSLSWNINSLTKH